MQYKIKLLLFVPQEEKLLKLEEYLTIRPDLDFISSNNLQQFKDQLDTYHPDACILSIDILDEIKAEEEILSLLNDVYTVQLFDEDFTVDPSVQDYLPVSLSDNELDAIINRIKIWSDQNNSINDKKSHILKLESELKDSLDLTVDVAFKLFYSRLPLYFDIINNVTITTNYIASYFKEFTEKDIQDTLIAAKLCQIGRILIPGVIKSKPICKDGNMTQDVFLRQLPHLSRELLQKFEIFQNAVKYIYHIYENIDGSGFPNNLQSWQIPLPSRIIRVALDFYEDESTGNKNKEQIIEKMQSLAGRIYDKRVLLLLDEFLHENDESAVHSGEIPVLLFELNPGMVLSRDIISSAGLKLMPNSAMLDQKKINFLLAHHSSDPILGKIFVKKDIAKT